MFLIDDGKYLVFVLGYTMRILYAYENTHAKLY